MNWIAALICVVVILAALAVWLIIEVRDRARARQWEFGCPIKGDVPASIPGETQWDRMLREVGDPADVLTTGDEFVMPTRG